MFSINELKWRCVWERTWFTLSTTATYIHHTYIHTYMHTHTLQQEQLKTHNTKHVSQQRMYEEAIEVNSRVWVCERVSERVSVCMHVCERVREWECVCVCMHVWMCVCVYYTNLSHNYRCWRRTIREYKTSYVPVYIYTHAFIHTYIYIYLSPALLQLSLLSSPFILHTTLPLYLYY